MLTSTSLCSGCVRECQAGSWGIVGYAGWSGVSRVVRTSTLMLLKRTEEMLEEHISSEERGSLGDVQERRKGLAERLKCLSADNSLSHEAVRVSLLRTSSPFLRWASVSWQQDDGWRRGAAERCDCVTGRGSFTPAATDGLTPVCDGRRRPGGGGSVRWGGGEK